MINKVTMNGIRSMDTEWSAELGRLTLLVGPNGSGKSARMRALEWAYMGHLSGEQAKTLPMNVCTTTDAGERGFGQMLVAVEDDAHKISRELSMDGAKTKEVVHVDGTKTSGRNAAPLIDLAYPDGAPVIDVPGWLAQGPTDMRAALLARLGEDVDGTALQEALDTAKSDANYLQQRTKELEASLQTAQTEVLEMGDGEAALSTPLLKSKAEEIEGQMAELRTKIAEGKASDDLRGPIEDKRIQALAELPAEIEDAREVRDNNIQEMRDAAAVYNSIDGDEDAAPEPISDALRDALQEAAECLRAVCRQPLADRLLAFIPNEELADRLAQKRQLQQEIESRIEDRRTQDRDIVNMEARLRELQEMPELGPGLDPNDETMLSAMVVQHDETMAAIRANGKRDAAKERIESLTKELGEAQDKHGTAKVATTVAIKGIEMVLGEVEQTLKCPILAIGVENTGKGFNVGVIQLDGTLRPWQSLSGGELAMFQAMLGVALCPNGCIMIEAAEMDDRKLSQLLDSVDITTDCQFIVATCHEPSNVPEAWKVVRLGDTL